MHPFVPLDWIETNFIELKNSDLVRLDLKYATLENFMNENLYGGFNRCFVHPEAFQKFQKACLSLERHYPGLRFHIWDTLRPQSVQKKMFDCLRGGPLENYVAPPEPGSLHSFGMALDLTLANSDGGLLEMGTDFDDFADLAQPVFEEKFLQSGELSSEAHRNRLILREVMESAGFKVLPHEWWHFNAAPKDQVHGRLPMLR